MLTPVAKSHSANRGGTDSALAASLQFGDKADIPGNDFMNTRSRRAMSASGTKRTCKPR